MDSFDPSQNTDGIIADAQAKWQKTPIIIVGLIVAGIFLFKDTAALLRGKSAESAPPVQTIVIGGGTSLLIPSPEGARVVTAKHQDPDVKLRLTASADPKANILSYALIDFPVFTKPLASAAMFRLWTDSIRAAIEAQSDGAGVTREKGGSFVVEKRDFRILEDSDSVLISMNTGEIQTGKTRWQSVTVTSFFTVRGWPLSMTVTNALSKRATAAPSDEWVEAVRKRSEEWRLAIVALNAAADAPMQGSETKKRPE